MEDKELNGKIGEEREGKGGRRAMNPIVKSMHATRYLSCLPSIDEVTLCCYENQRNYSVLIDSDVNGAFSDAFVTVTYI